MELFDIENKKLSFIPYKTDFTTITKNEKVFDNDVYSKYIAKAEVTGELIICNDVAKLKKYGTTLKRETYEEYLLFLAKYDYIFDGKSKF